MTLESVLEVYKALSDKTRLIIVIDIFIYGEIGCTTIPRSFNLSQPALSHHFDKLVKSGIVQPRKIGTAKFYSLTPQFRAYFKDQLSKIEIPNTYLNLE